MSTSKSASLHRMMNSLENLTGSVVNLYQEKVRTDLAFQLEQDKKAYANKLQELQSDPSNYENWQNEISAYSREIRANGSVQFKTPGASKMYEQASLQLANSYGTQAGNMATQYMIKDGQTKQKTMITDMVASTPWDTDSYNSHISSGVERIMSSQFYTDIEKEEQAKVFINACYDNAVSSGIQQVFDTTEGSYAEKAQATQDWLYSPEGAGALGDTSMTADMQQKYTARISAMENAAYTRQNRIDAEKNNEYDGVAGDFYAKGKMTGDFTEGIAYVQNSAMDPPDGSKPTYWLDKMLAGMEEYKQMVSVTTGSDKNLKIQYWENEFHTLKERVKNGEVAQTEAAAWTTEFKNQYGPDEDCGGTIREMFDYFNNPQLKDNEGYKLADEYFQYLKNNNEVLKENPDLQMEMSTRIKDFAMDPTNDSLRDPDEMKALLDSMLLKPVIHKLNERHRIETVKTFGGAAWDQNTLNTSETLTKMIQEGEFRHLIRTNDDGEYDTEYYDRYIEAWGYSEKDGYDDMGKFLETYMQDFQRASLRDFSGAAQVHIDQNQGFPIVEDRGERYVLRVIDGDEQKRLEEEEGITMSRHTELWYKWDKSKEQYKPYKEAGQYAD